jgi:hypothetical protein
MQLREASITGQAQLEDLVLALGAMRQEREITLVRGALELAAMIDAEFVVRSTGERWRLTCINDAHGGGSLTRVA